MRIREWLHFARNHGNTMTRMMSNGLFKNALNDYVNGEELTLDQFFGCLFKLMNLQMFLSNMAKFQERCCILRIVHVLF